jgi:hypothetical protein
VTKEWGKRFLYDITPILLKEKFEDAKGVIRSCKSKIPKG